MLHHIMQCWVNYIFKVLVCRYKIQIIIKMYLKYYLNTIFANVYKSKRYSKVFDISKIKHVLYYIECYQDVDRTLCRRVN